MITFKINMNMRYENMPKIIFFVLQSGLYWPVLFLSYFILPYFMPSELWTPIQGKYAIIAFISAILLNVFYYSAIEHHFNERENEYKKRMEPLNHLSADFGLLYDAKKAFVWDANYNDIWERLYKIIVRQNR